MWLGLYGSRFLPDLGLCYVAQQTIKLSFDAQLFTSRSLGDSYLQRTGIIPLKMWRYKVSDVIREIITTKRKYFSSEYIVNS